MLVRLAWRVLALVFVGLGLVGAVVPGLPTTVFLLLGAWASSHGWPELNRWLLTHPKFGPPIKQWQNHRAVPRQAKYAAAAMMSISAILIFWSAIFTWVKVLLIGLMVSVLFWLCTRPESGDDRSKAD
ncbi:YbaN family protein [uncultured Gilvimarinus sp.]|uniref:YbaN family protein n=1 Tax=uncultured Gilvimarinus sp. TaxID=1689143 RepID=UPI0030EE9D29|tara:strand:- start:556 stop:939 length:384 start_codon:yes stop_codon:yes gene_type:complete